MVGLHGEPFPGRRGLPHAAYLQGPWSTLVAQGTSLFAKDLPNFLSLSAVRGLNMSVVRLPGLGELCYGPGV